MMEILEVSYALFVKYFLRSSVVVSSLALLVFSSPFLLVQKQKKKKLCYFALPNLKRKVDRFMLLLGPFK